MLEKLRNLLHWKNEPKAKYELKFFDTDSKRYNVSYKYLHLCTCAKEQKQEVQNHFDKIYDGNPENLKKISDEFKGTYNLKSQHNRKKGYSKKSNRKNKLVNYRTAKLRFAPTPQGRVQVKTRDRKKEVNICSCYPEQMEEVQRKYDLLKKDNSLEAIKIILKKEYNLR